MFSWFYNTSEPVPIITPPPQPIIVSKPMAAGSLMSLEAIGGQNFPSNQEHSLCYNNYLNNCLKFQYPTKSALCHWESLPTKELEDPNIIKFIIGRNCDILTQIKLVCQYDPTQLTEKLRYQLFDSIKLMSNNTKLAVIDNILLKSLEQLNLTEQQQRFNRHIEPKGQIMITLPFWINADHPFGLINMQLTELSIIINNPNRLILDWKLELSGQYLNNIERHALARTGQNCNNLPYRFQHWQLINQIIPIGQQSCQMTIDDTYKDLSCPVTQMLIVVHDSTTQFDEIEHFEMKLNGYEYFDVSGYWIQSEMANRQLFSDKNVYLIDLGPNENLSLDRIDCANLTIQLKNLALVDKQVSVYFNCDRWILNDNYCKMICNYNRK